MKGGVQGSDKSKVSLGLPLAHAVEYNILTNLKNNEGER